LHHVKASRKEAAIILPAILIYGKRDKFGRHPLKLINDTEYQVSDITDSAGRQGFRLSSVIAANPYLFDTNTANTAYSLRKLINPNAQLKLFRITRNLGYPNVYSKYFIHRNLSIKEVEQITGEETTYDYDGTDMEFRILNKMLNSPKKQRHQ